MTRQTPDLPRRSLQKLVRSLNGARCRRAVRGWVVGDSHRRLSCLLMPASIAFRRAKPSLVVSAADISPSEEPPTAAYPLALTKAFAMRPVLRVGDYEVGETFCPRLCGHPGIRY